MFFAVTVSAETGAMEAVFRLTVNSRMRKGSSLAPVSALTVNSRMRKASSPAPVSALTVNAKTRQNVKKLIGCGLKTPVHPFGSKRVFLEKHEKREKTRSFLRYKLARANSGWLEMEICSADIQF